MAEVDPICDYLKSQGYELLPELYLKKDQADALYVKKGTEVTGGVDLNDYYKKTEADLLLAQKIDTISAENTFVKKADIEIPDLSNVATKTELTAKLDKTEAENLYQKKGDVVDIDLSNYYNKEEADASLKKKADKTSLDTEIQDRKDEDTKINQTIENLKKIYTYSEGQAVKQNDLILHAGKVYIVSKDKTLSTWDADLADLVLTDSDTISCVSYAADIKIKKGQLVIYEKQLYLCDNTIEKTTTWEADNKHMIQTTTKVDLTEYYNKTESDNLLQNKEDKITAGDDIVIDKSNNANTIKVSSATEANNNTIAKRTVEGSINAKMPANPTDDTVINNKKLTESLNSKADKTEFETEKTERTTKDTELETNIGTLSDLTSTDKTSLVKAINELKKSFDKFKSEFAMNNESLVWTNKEYEELKTKEDKIYLVKG